MTSPAIGASDADALPDYAVPGRRSAPPSNDHGYHVGRVERNLYWVTDAYQAAFLTTPDGVVLFDAPPTIGHNLQRAIDEIAAANGTSNQVTHLVYSHPTTTTPARPRCSTPAWSASAMRRPAGSCSGTTTRPSRRRR